MSTSTLQFRRRLSPTQKRRIKKRYETLTIARTKLQAKLVKPFSQIGKEARKKYKSLVTKPELKAAQALADLTKINIAKLYLPNKTTVGRAKIISLRREFKQAFLKTFKESNAIQALRDKHRRDLANGFAQFETSASVLDSLIANIPDMLAFPELEFVSFRPPYAFSEVRADGVTSQIRRDRSFADAQSGFILNDFDFRHSGGGTFNPVIVCDSLVGIGFTFTLPATGVLRVTAVMHNTLSLFQASIRDNFGWSDGNVRMSAGVYMNVLHPNNVLITERTSLAFLNLSSDGDDVSATESDIQTATPYTFTLISTGAFAQGETVDIIVGSKVHIRSSLDDMTCELTARVGWQVKQVSLEVI